MKVTMYHRRRNGNPGRGFTLVELVVASIILSVLTLMAIPLLRVTVKREREKELRQDLWGMRDAIDHYKDAADRGAFQTKVDSQNYHPDLETLVKGLRKSVVFGECKVDVNRFHVRCARKENTISAPNSHRPDDQDHGVGATLHAGRSRFRLLGRAERVRCLHQVAG